MIATALSYTSFEREFVQDSSLRDIEEVIRSNLGHGWFLTVEHAPQVTPHYTAWQRWGNSLAATKDPGAVIDTIARCRASHPKHVVRVHAQRFHPQASLMLWV